jgi:hypothetical protein
MRIFGGSARPVFMRIFALTFGWAGLYADFHTDLWKNGQISQKLPIFFLNALFSVFLSSTKVKSLASTSTLPSASLSRLIPQRIC